MIASRGDFYLESDMARGHAWRSHQEDMEGRGAVSVMLLVRGRRAHVAHAAQGAGGRRGPGGRYARAPG